MTVYKHGSGDFIIVCSIEKKLKYLPCCQMSNQICAIETELEAESAMQTHLIAPPPSPRAHLSQTTFIAVKTVVHVF